MLFQLPIRLTTPPASPSSIVPDTENTLSFQNLPESDLPSALTSVFSAPC